MHTITPTSLSELRKISLNNLQSFMLDLSATDSLSSLKILRCLPGKRISCIAEYREKKVFAKIFIDPKRAQKHWQKEKKGVELLAAKHILTPALIADFAIQNSAYVLLFEYQETAVNFQHQWQQATHNRQIQILSQLLALIAKHHNNHILQQDLHLDNFIFVGDQLYTLDGSEIIHVDVIDDQTAINNLGLLFAQFYPDNDANITAVLFIYIQTRNDFLASDFNSQVISQTLSKRQYRKTKFIAKTCRECSAFIVNKTWRKWFVCDRNFYNAALKALIDNPETYCQQGTVLKNGNTCTVFKLNFHGTDLLIKRYNIKNWRHRMSRLLRKTRALNSWQNAHLLLFYGIKTPHPIAVIETRFGPLRGKAYLITEYLPALSSDEFFNGSQPDQSKQNIAFQITSMLKQLAELFIGHGDLKANNILITNEQAFLIDLDSMKQFANKKAYARAGIKDQNRFRKNWEGNLNIVNYFDHKTN